MTPAAGRLAVAAAVALLVTGCTPSRQSPRPFTDHAGAAGALRLVAFDSCEDLLRGLRTAAKAVAGPYGLRPGDVAFSAESNARDAGGAAPGAVADSQAGSPATAKTYSGTNTHEADVDEPDVVKTDGRRIITATDGVLRVVDVATRRVTGTLDLATQLGQEGPPGLADSRAYASINLLLAGDRVLMLLSNTSDQAPKLLLVDVAGRPRVLSRYETDGWLVDARQSGTTVRAVLRSAPRLAFPAEPNGTDADRLQANRSVIDRATVDDWLPRYRVSSEGETESGQLDCRSVSRPAEYSGRSMLTVLTFDLTAPKLGSGNPVTVVADADTVYSSGANLYVATDTRWLPTLLPDGSTRVPTKPTVNVYKFDTRGTGKPRFAASGSVPGWLLNQYSLSDWDGHLRVATTNTQRTGAESESSVYVLRQDGDELVEHGRVGGLGKGERIYAVRFTGATGYVVTFRKTDPLYTLDLRDPRAPRVIGELKITGYSAYLHPAGTGRLIGIGQEATTEGRREGTQVSVFDVSDLAKPSVLAQHHVRHGYSTAEHDPHAFLYWEPTGLLVVPLQEGPSGLMADQAMPAPRALALRVGDRTVTELGLVTHPQGASARPWWPSGYGIQRSLVIDDALWTVSSAGLKASNAQTLADVAWVGFR